MNYSSMFGALLHADFTKESTKYDFLKSIQEYISVNGNHFFFSVFKIRRKQIIKHYPELISDNTAYIFSHHSYLELVGQPTEGLTRSHLIIETIASKLYPNWLDFWCDFLIYDVKSKYTEQKSISRKPKLPFQDDDYTSEAVPDISTDSRLYYTLHHEYPMALSDAVYLINLELFVKEAKWYEMLFHMDLSRSGTHLVVSTNMLESEFPIIVATTLIQSWDKRCQWLSYQEYFQSNSWNYCLPNSARNTLSTSGLFSAPLKANYLSVKEFESDFQNKLSKTEKVCELLRLTVSGSLKQKMYYLYLSQKHLVEKVSELGYDFCLTIIEQPFLLNYYLGLNKNAYFSSSYCNISKLGEITYKGFWNTKVLLESLKSCDFFEYKSIANSIKWKTSEEIYA